MEFKLQIVQLRNNEAENREKTNVKLIFYKKAFPVLQQEAKYLIIEASNIRGECLCEIVIFDIIKKL